MHKTLAAMLFAFSAGVISTPVAAQAFDEEAAKALFKRNDCGKCHHPTRDKKGAALKKVAEKLNAKPDPVKLVITNVTTGPKVKMLDDNKEEEHKIIDTKDDKQIRNLAAWILNHK
jgi:cytochrome c